MEKRKLSVELESITKDIFGVYEVRALVNEKTYTFPITSEFILRKVKSLLRRKKPGKALYLLKQFKTTGFNAFEEREQHET